VTHLAGSPAALRARQLRRVLSTEGVEGLAYRIRMRLLRSVTPAPPRRLAVSREDLAAASKKDAEGWKARRMMWDGQGPLTIAWVTPPLLQPSGGSEVMLRLIEGFERAGHRCRLYVQDHDQRPLDQHESVVRAAWPQLKLELHELAGGIDDAHAIFATSWPTAYPVYASDAAGMRCYLIMDYEPLFYPAGTEALLAEQTYRFDFYGITGGVWLKQLIGERFGMKTDHFDFAWDERVYRLDSSIDRPRLGSGICYYCRPSTPRRADELATLALELFTEWHPEIDVHVFGSPPAKRTYRSIEHGIVSDSELSALYNRCVSGLVLSATNASLVPYEMLASGCVPVVNDGENNRLVLDNPHIEFAAPTPYSLAAALSGTVGLSPEACTRRAYEAAASVQRRSWKMSTQHVVDLVTAAIKTYEV
jgi:hypothetical protein